MLARRLSVAVVVLAVGLLALWGPRTHVAMAESIVDQVAGDIICQCGCTYTLEACASAMGCSVGDEMRAEIASLGASGMTKAQILDYYVSKYGSTILAAPTKEGFNLTAWIMPFAAIAAGGVLIYLLLQVWARKRAPVPVAEREKRRAALDPYLERVERDLREF